MLDAVAELFRARQEVRMRLLGKVDARLVEGIADYRLVPLASCSAQTLDAAVDLTAAVFGGREHRPDNLSFLLGLSDEVLRPVFKALFTEFLSIPDNPSLALLDGQGTLEAAVLCYVVRPSRAQEPAESALTPVTRVLDIIDMNGWAAARAAGLPCVGDPGAPVFICPFTAARTASLSTTVGSLAKKLGVTIPDSIRAQNLGFLKDMFDGVGVGGATAFGIDTTYVVESVSPATDALMEAQNAFPPVFGGRRSVQRKLYSRALGELLEEAGLAVPAHVQSRSPDQVREAAAFRAGFWYGRFERESSS
jgi:hypothetical protein